MINTKHTTTKDWILLFASIAVTVLFVVFAEPVFVSLYLGTDAFADAMYDFNLYFTLSLFISIVVWAFAILYYWVIDQVKLSSFTGWAFFCLLALAFAPAIAYFYPMSVFDAENLEFMTDLAPLAIVTIPMTLLLYLIVSVGIKALSTNCTTRPF